MYQPWTASVMLSEYSPDGLANAIARRVVPLLSLIQKIHRVHPPQSRPMLPLFPRKLALSLIMSKPTIGKRKIKQPPPRRRPRVAPPLFLLPGPGTRLGLHAFDRRVSEGVSEDLAGELVDDVGRRQLARWERLRERAVRVHEGRLEDTELFFCPIALGGIVFFFSAPLGASDGSS